jgi:hypothetical protein
MLDACVTFNGRNQSTYKGTTLLQHSFNTEEMMKKKMLEVGRGTGIGNAEVTFFLVSKTGREATSTTAI